MDNDASESSLEQHELCLPQSGLSLIGQQFIRKDQTGNQIAKLDLGKISELRCKRSLHWGAVLFALFCFLGIALLLAMSNSRFWILVIGAPLAFSLFIAVVGGLIETELIVVSETGEVAFPIQDPPSDAQAFVLSVRQRMQGRG